jgi:hypothetical protein
MKGPSSSKMVGFRELKVGLPDGTFSNLKIWLYF